LSISGSAKLNPLFSSSTDTVLKWNKIFKNSIQSFVVLLACESVDQSTCTVLHMQNAKTWSSLIYIIILYFSCLLKGVWLTLKLTIRQWKNMCYGSSIQRQIK
jgi:hypothetical protein